MHITRKPAWSARLRGLFLLGHPGPVFFHLLGVTLFALLACWPRPVWSVLLLIVGAHTAMQLAIAVFNDYCDRAKDAVGQPKKPIPSGLVTPLEALVVGYGLLVLMILLLLPLPPLAWLISLLYLALGMAYNLGLKATPLSGVVFALAMPLIPLYAFAGVGHIPPFLIWLIPLGFLLGVALNLANSLPDLEEDATNRVRTLAVVLGRQCAFFVGDALLVLSAALILLLHLSGLLRAQSLVLTITLALTGLLFVALLTLTGPGKPRETRKRYFYLVVLICLILAGGWLLGVLL